MMDRNDFSEGCSSELSEGFGRSHGETPQRLEPLPPAAASPPDRQDQDSADPRDRTPRSPRDSGNSPFTADFLSRLNRFAENRVLRTGRRDIEPQSIVQRVVQRVIVQQRDWTGRETECLRYTFRAIVNEICTSVKRQSRLSGLPSSDDLPAPEAAAIRSGTDALHDAVLGSGLGRMAMDLARLHGIEGRTWDQVADELDISPENARTSWHRVRETVLRGVLQSLRHRFPHLDWLVAERALVRGASPASIAEDLEIEVSEVFERLAFQIIPVIHDAFGDQGLEAIRRMSRRAIHRSR